MLCQEAVDAKGNECAAILAILGRLSVAGALVTIDAIATNPTIAQVITEGGGDYVLALKQNQPTLHGEVAAYFGDPATPGLQTLALTDKDHREAIPRREHARSACKGRIETRRYQVSTDIDWLNGDRR